MNLISHVVRFARDTTVRVVCALLFIVTMVLMFRDVPSALRWPVRVVMLALIVWLVITSVHALREMRFTMKTALFTLILGSMFYGMIWLLCVVFIGVMSARDDRIVPRGSRKLVPETRDELHRAVVDRQGISEPHPVIGWLPRANMKHKIYTTNSQRLRGGREYPTAAPDESKRYLCMGDSFTFGVAVKDSETYPASAEALRPGTEWLNFGTPGACLTQAFLRYQEQARSFGGKTVVIGFMTNDAQRTVNVFRPFLNAESGCPLPKPYARLIDGKLSIEPNPCPTEESLRRIIEDEANELRRLLALDYLSWSGRWQRPSPISHTLVYVFTSRGVDKNLDALFTVHSGPGDWLARRLPIDPYGDDIWNRESPGFLTNCKLLEHFVQTVIKDGRTPLVVIIPGPQDLDDYVHREPRVYAPLTRYLEDAKIRHVDFLQTLVVKHRGHLSNRDIFVNAHYQPHVNRTLAEAIIDAIEQR